MKMNLPKIVAIALWFVSNLLYPTLYAQENAGTKNITVYVTKMPQAVQQLNQFLQQHHATILRSDFTINRNFVEFQISTNELTALDSLATALGYVTQNSYYTQNLKQSYLENKRRIANLKYENELLANQLSDSLLPAFRADELRRKVMNNMSSITSFEMSNKELEERMEGSTCAVSFTINDEMSTPNNSRVSFINMPGLEYGYLHIENPKAGVSAKAYQGVAIKYMFTRGKSYFNLGAYKAIDNNTTDSTLINELFMINFGQDFYPRHFGRGKRKFLNLYTGYQIGGFIQNRNNDKNAVFIPNANISFGVELLKSKHVLIDNKASYFLPLDGINRNMRGILYQASFNFVF